MVARRPMRKRLFHSRRDLFSGLLLAVLLFRAYVPVGFMPASGAPFRLEMCPATYQVPMPAHHGHHDSATHSHFENCPFGSAPAAGPIAHLVGFDPPAPVVSKTLHPFEPLRLSIRLDRDHPPRGPPPLA
jgi:hypothetical protein